MGSGWSGDMEGSSSLLGFLVLPSPLWPSLLPAAVSWAALFSQPCPLALLTSATQTLCRSQVLCCSNNRERITVAARQPTPGIPAQLWVAAGFPGHSSHPASLPT